VDSKKIRRWYQRHGMEYLPEDWGQRSETGESDSKQTATGPYGGQLGNEQTTLVANTGEMQWWWEDKRPPWTQRHDRAWVVTLDEFFAPYLSMLNRPKGNLLRQLINDRLTYEAIGKEVGMSKQGAWKQLKSAIQEVTRLIALDDPEFVPQPDGRRRDRDAEREAAGRVFARYLEGRQHGNADGPGDRAEEGTPPASA
jgi:hypothetical protein